VYKSNPDHRALATSDFRSMSAPYKVPLSQDVLALIKELPRFGQGEFVFTTTFGTKPVTASASQRRASTARWPRSWAVGRSDRWTIHDIRRTVRTHLSALPTIPDRVRESMIGHALHKVYDQYSYTEEKRSGFEAWSARLRGILQSSNNVVECVTRK
jgi:integrase